MRRLKDVARHGCVCVVMMVVAIQGAQAQLAPVVQESGAVTLSVDALGTNDPAGGSVMVDKPMGATVRSAYLAACSHAVSGPSTINNGDVQLLGTPVNWTQAVFNNRVGWARSYLKQAGLLHSPRRGYLPDRQYRSRYG